VVELAGHRRWHATHLACGRCGATDGAALELELELAGQEPGGGVALCPAHASEEAHARCAPCLAAQASGDALDCAACGDALGRGGARWGEQPLAAAGPARARPLCARCLDGVALRPACLACCDVVRHSEDRAVLVPTREDRIESAASADLPDGVVTGEDGRMRCHLRCLFCRDCGLDSDSARDMAAGGQAFLLPRAGQSGFDVFCAAHAERAVRAVAELAHAAAAADRDGAAIGGLDEDDEGSNNHPQARPAAGGVAGGLFLYVDALGKQAGPVDGNTLWQLAVAGLLDGNTHVWTPGMAEWTPLARMAG
jgi:hypothetical protein